MTGVAERASFAEWTRMLADSERCPWPGPRPFDDRDAPVLLVGRDEDKRRFRHEVENHRLIFLTGPSGVGKTSLLKAGLVPALVDNGYEVVVCRQWGSHRREDNPARFLAAKIHAALADRADLDWVTDQPELFMRLEDRLGDRAVIVLDQFEELIRYSPVLTQRLYELLLDINAETRIKVVVSFRDEYLLRLRELERNAKPFSLSRMVLDEVGAEHAYEVAMAGNAVDGRTGLAIDEHAARTLANNWAEALRATTLQDSDDPFSRIGLLHYQAVLYALHAHAQDGCIKPATIDTFRASRGVRDDDAVGLFVAGLLASIDVKLGRCDTVARDLGLDAFLVEGARQVIARAASHLSSAGYKLVREVKDLADVAMADELETLLPALAEAGAPLGAGGSDGRLDRGQYDALFTTVVDSILADRPAEAVDLFADRATVAGAADAGASGPATGWRARLHPDAPADVADPRDVSAGPMSGLAPAAVLIEELRRFAFALAWLDATSLVRLSRPGAGALMVSLVHDGFGSALNRWADKPLDGPTGALHALTAPRGAEFAWQVADPPAPDPIWPELGRDEPQTLVNLRWRGGAALASFKDVVFVNCDFRGMFFNRCAFTGVTFLNCLLDGVIFSDCRFYGSFEPAAGSDLPETPVFAVGVPPEYLAAMVHYRGADPDADTVLAQVPGAPAIPVSDATAASGWTAERGGMVIYGGRVSSLVLRACAGDVSIRYGAGSGLDVVEAASGRYEIFASTLRHLAFTQAIAGEAANLEIEAARSVLTQVWLGNGLTGTFRARDCMLVHVWSEPDGLEATAVEGCRHHGLVGVTPDGSCSPLGREDATFTFEDVDPDGAFTQKTQPMDYRRNPDVTRRRGSSPRRWA